MKIIRFAYRHGENWGVLDSGRIRVLRQPPFGGLKYSGDSAALSQVKLLAPALPSKIVMVGLNYRDHARELKMRPPKEPIIFLKPPGSVIGPGGRIILPRGVARLDYEAELALVIKDKAKNITAQRADKVILGYTCLNDVTARDIQRREGQWTRAKSFDSFCPLGPWVETDFNPGAKRITASLNGIIKQDSSTADFIFTPGQLVSFISDIMTLLPGDVISTGTPAGVGPMRPADVIEIAVEGIGELRNCVSAG